MQPPRYLEIATYIESCFAKHGDCHLGVAWPKAEDTAIRHHVLLGVMGDTPPDQTSILDLGSGLGHGYEYLLAQDKGQIAYTGLDISPQLVAHCRQKFPGVPFQCVDILQDPDFHIEVDFVIINGIFTFKGGIPHDDMLDFWRRLLTRAFSFARVGLAFNAMSKVVDWERDDLFHLPFDVAADFIGRNLSRRFVFRHDYPLYEYATYVYR
jgi:SAM-dependent methyltransferase